MPNAGNSVNSIAVSPDGSDVYIGGTFGKLDGVARTYAGEVTSATGALLPWAPNVNGTVTSVAVAPDDSRVLVGGYFTQFNGAAQQAVVDVDATTGSTNNLTSIVPNVLRLQRHREGHRHRQRHRPESGWHRLHRL